MEHSYRHVTWLPTQTSSLHTSARDDTKATEDNILSIVWLISFSSSQIIRNHNS